jgi:hypothetical protein
MNVPQRPRTDEESQAKVPALALLLKLGWSYLTPNACLSARGGERAVLMQDILWHWLAAFRFTYRGSEHPLSSGSIAQVLKAIADRREWSSRADIALALVRNPKTPVPSAVRLLDNVGATELRVLAKDQNARAPIQQAARKKVLG